jgi:H+-translocating NAD(P) transhydrogenase subunit alpha
MTLKIGIVRETAPGERRVALDPPTAAKLMADGHEVLVQAGAGTESGHPDDSWGDCTIVEDVAELAGKCQILLSVRRPEPEVLEKLGQGSVVIGQLSPYQDFDALEVAAKQGLSLIAMELVPRITRAQAMDVLSSQATIAGYKAVIIAADIAPRIFPMLTTAAGTLRPAKVVVIGAGVAGLQAIATARRLGAQVEAYDIRAAAREQVESLGAKMIDTGVDAETEGGYARELTDEERQQQADALAKHLAKADAVISTAAIPGRPAPKIITREMVDDMAPGSVIVDLAAETGGNCELTKAGETVNHGGVLVHGPTNLPSRAPLHASEMYARNVHNLVKLLIDEEGGLKVDTEDDVIAGCLLAHDGVVVHEKFLEKD